ncbi:MAG: DDE-type integrase/transposase/recombinase [Acidobacteriota bacterium]
MTGVIGVSSQRRLSRKKGEFMWDELNRILGVSRKSELSLGEPGPEASVGPGNESDAAGNAAPARSPGEPEGLEPVGPGEPEDAPDEIGSDGEASPADDADYAAIFGEESRVDGDLAPWDSGLPPTEDGPVTESGEPRPFGFALPHAARRKPAGRGLVKPEPAADKTPTFKPEQRLLILDCWQRSGLPAQDFADLVGISKHSLYAWKKAFTQHGPAGLMDRQRGAKAGSRLPDLTQRSILMLKQAHPDWGCERIRVMLARGPALGASPGAVAHVLREAGYELEEAPTRPHPDKVRSFERATPNQLWQTDLFTFVLKRQNRRVYLVAFMDDHSRFLVSFGLHASQSTALVLEVLRAGITSYGAPREVLTDNGAQYVTWRGKSQFTKELEKRGIAQVVARPRHPQTLGKIERFWGTLWRECLEAAVFLDLADARVRIGHFIDWYNFRRPHSGIDSLAPADRFFGAAPDVLRTLRAQVAANALELARNGVPRPPFYVTGQVGGKNFSLHAEGERVFLTQDGQQRREVDLVPPAQGTTDTEMPPPVCPDGSPAGAETGSGCGTGEPSDEPAPGTSPLDDFLPPRGGSDAPVDPPADPPAGRPTGENGGAP